MRHRVAAVVVILALILAVGFWGVACWLLYTENSKRAVENCVTLLIIGAVLLGILLLGAWDDLTEKKPSEKPEA